MDDAAAFARLIQALRPAKRTETVAHRLFEQVTDTIREAARIPVHRRLTPEVLRAACLYGTGEIFTMHT